ncbi:6-hydroxymethylpterin diphosphokinase MptE-like protein [Cerasicoccus maritimus]|uniref:6-hydroxymethylpterin diphosphokinase MptE-like protein n=1 Tax=Cerasicoccus maritimus TaxID=490089 RepID=UPI00285288E3|nr:6-hydroxymethylpterin diphosphokinase MptE-like protein [Cerasicoccus maritimus]
MSLTKRIKRIRTKLAHGVHQVAGLANIALSENDRRIQSFKDKHQGQAAFVLGNGPSLTPTDLDLLKPYPTFASNKIYLAYEQTDWRPTYYSVLDVLVAENNRQEVAAVDSVKIHSSDIIPYLGHAITPDITWLHNRYYNQSHQHGEFKFATNPMAGIHAGWTVIYLQLQLAYYMGFQEVYMLGLDFSFMNSPSTGQMSAHGEILKSEGEVNHFHKDYRKPGETWTVPRLDLQIKAFEAARKTYETNGRKLVNASRKTKLECLERADLDEVLATLAQ